VDADQDGMPDDWESARGLNPGSSSDGAGDRDGDGYTNVEEYLNGLVPAWVYDPAMGIEDRGRRVAGAVLFAYPNPAPRGVTVEFGAAGSAPGRWGIGMEVFDIAGRRVRTLVWRDSPEDGAGRICWDGRDDQGRDVPNGVYFFRLTINGASRTRRLVLER
jgi:hypothetical protein